MTISRTAAQAARSEVFDEGASRGVADRGPLRVLVVEDSEDDADLLARELRRLGYDLTWARVETATEMEAALTRQPWDLVLSDYSLPQFDAPQALRVLHDSGLDLPCIIVSGVGGEDTAVDAMRAGASDFVTKGTYARLGPAIERELREAESRREHRRVQDALLTSEAQYRTLFENANDLLYTHDLSGQFTSINDAAVRTLGYSRAEGLGMNIADIVVPEHLSRAIERTMDQLAGGSPPVEELGICAKDGRRLTVEVNTRLMYRDGQPCGVQGIARDVTERKRAEQRTAALLDIARDIAGTLDLQTLLDGVHRRIAEALPCEWVATFRADPTNGLSHAICQYATPAMLPRAVTLGDVSANDLLTRDETLVLADAAAAAGFPADLSRTLGLHALVAMPLRVRGRHFGTVVVANTDGARRFDAEQVALLEGIARQLAIAIEAAELYQVQREEAKVSGALARVGRELIAALNRPAMLERLCQLTTEALDCDASYTLLRPGGDDQYTPVASAGEVPERWQEIRSLTIPVHLFERAQRLDRDDVVAVDVDALDDRPIAVLARRFGITAALDIALRRGGEVVGTLIACYRNGQRFTPVQIRIAAGLAQLASLIIDRARLVDALERAGRLKADFVATMSHELRTPLNIIMGYNELMLEGAFDALTPDQHDAAQRINGSAQQLLELITATLDLSRLEAGGLPLELGDIAPTELLVDLKAQIAPLCASARLPLHWQVAPRLPRLYTDPEKLKRILKNLIDNALKFTEAGSVTVTVDARAGGVEFQVRDTGPGIAPDALPIIFEPFRQGDGSMTRRHGGIGLGLYIAHRLLDVLGGRIGVESVVGVGSTFTVWVPTVVGAATNEHGRGNGKASRYTSAAVGTAPAFTEIDAIRHPRESENPLRPPWRA